MINIRVEGANEIIKKITEIDKKLSSDDIKEYLAKKMLDVINKTTEEKLKNNSNYIASNKYKLIDKGIMLYNDVQAVDGSYYSLIIEYGSGTKAEGSYNTGKVYWYVPEEKGPNLENYNYKSYITDDGNKIYLVFGQEPKHIYTDAAKEIEKNVTKWVMEYMKMEVR